MYCFKVSLEENSYGNIKDILNEFISSFATQ